MRAAGVNPIDWKILHGFMRQVMPVDLPGGLGSDVAGVVDQVGEGVTAFSVGDEVLGASITPSYAQSALADPAALVAKLGLRPVGGCRDSGRYGHHRLGGAQQTEDRKG